jgi:hypothetical protein
MPLVASFVEAGSEPYFVLLPETDLGYVYRGDTLILPLWEARNQRGELIDLTGSTVWFTAKTDIGLADDGPNSIQCSTLLGGLEILDADDGLYQVTVPPSATQGLTDDTVYVFDAQVKTAPVAKFS